MLLDLVEDLGESIVTEIGRSDGIVREVFHQKALLRFQKFELAFVAGHEKNGVAVPSGLDRHIGAEDMFSVACILIHGTASNICFAIFLSEAPKEALATSTEVLQLVKLNGPSLPTSSDFSPLDGQLNLLYWSSSSAR
ncbi:unnamed protein product [Symbiodinium sp. CCMP2592]|nr:unnamed protein product [Symbiodinium sp. CCMP2592]